MKWRDFGLGLGVGLIILAILASGLVATQPKEITVTRTVTEKMTVTDKTTIRERNAGWRKTGYKSCIQCEHDRCRWNAGISYAKQGYDSQYYYYGS